MAGKTVQRLPLWIPQDPLHRQSGNHFYSQRPFLKNSVWANTIVPIYSSRIPYWFFRIFHAHATIELSPKLSLLAVVDCWAHLGINPYIRLAVTPVFRLFLCVEEHLFQLLTLLESALHSAIYDHWHRADESLLREDGVNVFVFW